MGKCFEAHENETEIEPFSKKAPAEGAVQTETPTRRSQEREWRRTFWPVCEDVTVREGVAVLLFCQSWLCRETARGGECA